MSELYDALDLYKQATFFFSDSSKKELLKRLILETKKEMHGENNFFELYRVLNEFLYFADNPDKWYKTVSDIAHEITKV